MFSRKVAGVNFDNDIILKLDEIVQIENEKSEFNMWSRSDMVNIACIDFIKKYQDNKGL